MRVARHQGPLRARGAGELTGLTGVSDPYEEPVDADPVLDTQEVGAEECADRILMGADGTGLPRTSPTDALCLKGRNAIAPKALDETLRAVAVMESDWHQDKNGDFVADRGRCLAGYA